MVIYQLPSWKLTDWPYQKGIIQPPLGRVHVSWLIQVFTFQSAFPPAKLSLLTWLPQTNKYNQPEILPVMSGRDYLSRIPTSLNRYCRFLLGCYPSLLSILSHELNHYESLWTIAFLLIDFLTKIATWFLCSTPDPLELQFGVGLRQDWHASARPPGGCASNGGHVTLRPRHHHRTTYVVLAEVWFRWMSMCVWFVRCWFKWFSHLGQSVHVTWARFTAVEWIGCVITRLDQTETTGSFDVCFARNWTGSKALWKTWFWCSCIHASQNWSTTVSTSNPKTGQRSH